MDSKSHLNHARERAGALKCPHHTRIWCLPWTELTIDQLPKALLIPTLWLYEAQNAKAAESKVAMRATYEPEKQSLTRNTMDTDLATATACVNLRSQWPALPIWLHI